MRLAINTPERGLLLASIDYENHTRVSLFPDSSTIRNPIRLVNHEFPQDLGRSTRTWCDKTRGTGLRCSTIPFPQTSFRHPGLDHLDSAWSLLIEGNASILKSHRSSYSCMCMGRFLPFPSFVNLILPFGLPPIRLSFRNLPFYSQLCFEC